MPSKQVLSQAKNLLTKMLQNLDDFIMQRRDFMNLVEVNDITFEGKTEQEAYSFLERFGERVLDTQMDVCLLLRALSEKCKGD